MPRSLHSVPSAGGTRYVFDAQGIEQVPRNDKPAANHNGSYGGVVSSAFVTLVDANGVKVSHAAVPQYEMTTAISYYPSMLTANANQQTFVSVLFRYF